MSTYDPAAIAFMGQGCFVRAATVIVLALAALPALAQSEPPIRGVVRAIRDASVATDFNARILTLPFREGASFNAGDTLVTFDCDRTEAESRAAEAETAINRIAFDNAQLLDRRHAIGRVEVQAAKARWEKAQASADALRVRVRDCRIVAPFTGRVAEMRAREHEMPVAGQPLLRIVDTTALEIDLIVPSAWLAWLRTAALQVKVDETGKTYAATVIRTAAAVDPVSQTIRITAAFAPGDISAVLPGMSLDAAFERPTH
ncbi:efflux RND transporter periplasmic adaptor subunit [Methylorubrum suomiense]